jgi:hypothetical protein
VAAGCPNEAQRTASGSTQLPDCRAYEMVTPPYKEGSAVFIRTIAADGSIVGGESSGIFAGSESGRGGEVGGLGSEYSFTRTESGWQTVALGPSNIVFPASGKLDAGEELDRSLWRLRTTSQPEGEGDLYVREADGSFVRVGPLQPPGEVARFGEEFRYSGASGDLSHVLISKEPEMGLWPAGATAEGPSLYEYSGLAQTEPRLVGVSNEGRLANNGEAHLISACGTVLGSARDRDNAISADGATVFFTALACEGSPSVGELEARIAQSHTVDVSEPVLPPGEQCTGPCAAAEHREGIFQGASADGTKVFFTTEQPLLDSDGDTGNDLYEAEVEASGVRRLIQASAGGAGDLTPGTDAGVLGVARISEDGSHVYFVATGVLTDTANGEGEQADPGADNLYVSEGATGRTAFVARLSPADERLWQLRDNGRPVESTPDGRRLIFVSAADLTGAGGGPQLYEYDADTGALLDASLGQTSATSAPQILSPDYEVRDSPSARASTLSLSDDGSYVFFTSTDSLVSRATPGITNVYEYHAGALSLISDGQDTTPSTRLLGTDSHGTSVFFTSVDPLVPTDVDSQQDVYDARIEGGFPASVEAPPGCTEDTCQGPLSASPPQGLAASSTLTPDAAPVVGPQVKPAKTTPKAKKPKAKKPKRRKPGKKHKSTTRKASGKHRKPTAIKHPKPKSSPKRAKR